MRAARAIGSPVDAPHQHVNVYYGQPLAGFGFEDYGSDEFFLHFRWNSADREQLIALEGGAVSIDQLMRDRPRRRRGPRCLRDPLGQKRLRPPPELAGNGHERIPSGPARPDNEQGADGVANRGG